MRISSPSLAASLVVTISCLAWTGAITYASVHLLQLSNPTGWLIAGSLGLSSIAAIGFILFEMKHAMEMPDDLDPLVYMNQPVPPAWNKSPSAPPATVHATSAFRTPS